MDTPVIVWATAPTKEAHDKMPKRPKRLADYPKSEIQRTTVINRSEIVRNGALYELRDGMKIISTREYKPYFIAEFRDGTFAHLPIKSKKDALKYCVKNHPDFCAIWFDEEALQEVIIRNLRERV